MIMTTSFFSVPAAILAYMREPTIYNRYNKYEDKIIQTLEGFDSEETTPPKPAIFEF